MPHKPTIGKPFNSLGLNLASEKLKTGELRDCQQERAEQGKVLWAGLSNALSGPR